MKNPGFDSGHGQTETLSGFLVREPLKFAEQNDGSRAPQYHYGIVCRRRVRHLATEPLRSRSPNPPRTRRKPSSVPSPCAVRFPWGAPASRLQNLAQPLFRRAQLNAGYYRSTDGHAAKKMMKRAGPEKTERLPFNALYEPNLNQRLSGSEPKGKW